MKQAGVFKFEVPNWKKEEVEKMRDTINVVVARVTDSSKMFARKEDLDPVYWMLGAALGWGGLPAEAATCVNVFSGKNDGRTPYTLTGKDVPVDAFWSVTLYHARVGCRSTNTTLTRSTTSPQRRTETEVSPSTSAETPSSPTSCPS